MVQNIEEKSPTLNFSQVQFPMEFLLIVTVTMLSNHPGGAWIGPKIPDWMSNNLAGREK